MKISRTIWILLRALSTGHKEEWGTFLDVKHWPEIKNPKKYVGQRVVIGSVTDGYNPQEEQFGNTRKLLEQLIGSDADILICTKSDLVVRDIDLLKKLGRVTVSWSINTLDENFKNDMDSASSIERRIAAMKQGSVQSVSYPRYFLVSRTLKRSLSG